MKKQLLIATLAAAACTANAQTAKLDTVYTGASYANQVWYSLENDEQGSSAKNNWDLGFRIQGGINLDILVNHTGSTDGAVLWVYPKADITGWSSVDTSGLKASWAPLYNSEVEWTGALGRYADPAGTTTADYGWGFYNKDGDHKIKGDSIYIIKTQGGKFKKLKIDLFTTGTYNFTYANLDGSDETSSTLAKATYPNKKYAYFNLDTKAAVDREPTLDKWDLVFGQYSSEDYMSMGMPGYTVTGVLANDTVEIAKAIVDPSVRAGYTSYGAHTFSRNINGLGYNWKKFEGGAYKLNDSAVYFVKSNLGSIWKVIFTGFTGSATGGIIFSKEKLPTTSIGDKTKSTTTLAIAPNPSVNGQNVSVVYNFEHAVNNAVVNVYDMTGRMVLSQELEKSAGLHAQVLNTNMASGVYIINVVADNERTQQRLIVQ